MFFRSHPQQVSRCRSRRRWSVLDLEIEPTGTGMHCRLFNAFVVDLLINREVVFFGCLMLLLGENYTELINNCTDRLEIMAPTLWLN